MTSRENETLHWAYLEFAIRASRAPLSRTRPPSLPARRNVVEAIRYSYDFLDAAAEFAYAIVKDGPDGDTRPKSWLTSYMDRRWDSLSLSDKLGMLSFATSREPFWLNDSQRQLFEDLRSVRDALTHPRIFGVERIEEFRDFSDRPALSSRQMIRGRLRSPNDTIAKFAQTLSGLGRDDGRKAVEIAVRHAGRLEQLFGRPNAWLFGRIGRRGRPQDAAVGLAGMSQRFFDSAWTGASPPPHVS